MKQTIALKSDGLLQETPVNSYGLYNLPNLLVITLMYCTLLQLLVKSNTSTFDYQKNMPMNFKIRDLLVKHDESWELMVKSADRLQNLLIQKLAIKSGELQNLPV